MKRCRVIRKRWKKKSHGYNASAREQFNPGSARLTRLANKFQIPAPSPLPISLDPSNLHLYSMQQSSSSHTDLLEEKGKEERKKEEKKREESLEKISTRTRLKYGAKRVVAVSRRCCWWRSIWRPHCPPSPSPPCTREWNAQAHTELGRTRGYHDRLVSAPSSSSSEESRRWTLRSARNLRRWSVWPSLFSNTAFT